MFSLFMRICVPLAACALVSCATGHVREASPQRAFLDSSAVDLALYLPDPPLAASAQAQTDLKSVLELQAARTPLQVANANADVAENVWRFSDAVNDPRFTESNLPVLAKFFERVAATEGAVTDLVKEKWNRPRPFLVSGNIKPVVPLPHSGSYPSGHATLGTLMGIVLSKMIPEKRSEIMARALEFANNRVLAGVHFPSDIVAGRISGSLIANTLMSRADFQREFSLAQNELRSVLKQHFSRGEVRRARLIAL